MSPARLIVAIDTTDLLHAQSLVRAVAPVAGMVKLGLEFFSAQGAPGVAAIADLGLPVFLDLKLHDIPNTVASAVAALRGTKAALLTIHASGGVAMIAAAVDAAGAAPSRMRVLAVTVLTSLDAAALRETGVNDDPLRQVVRLARLAVGAGADGIVCGPREVSSVREAVGPDAILVVPGIRPAGSAADDQARATTPAEVARAGADWVVVGRPITRAADPAAAALAIADELTAA